MWWRVRTVAEEGARAATEVHVLLTAETNPFICVLLPSYRLDFCLMDISYLFCIHGNNIWTFSSVSIVLYKYESISVFRMFSGLMRSYL